MAAHREHIGELLQQLADEESCTDLENEEGEELPYCVVCDKSFKSLNAKINHENSKQHRKQLAELKRHMKEEDQALFEDISTALPPHNEERKGKKVKRRAKKKKGGDGESDQEAKNLKESPVEQEGVLSNGLEDVDTLRKEVAEVSVAATNNECAEETNTTPAATKKSEKKKRVERKDSGVATGAISGAPVNTGPKISACDKCKQVFESRTKLFEHLRITGHATVKVSTTSQPLLKNKKERRK